MLLNTNWYRKPTKSGNVGIPVLLKRALVNLDTSMENTSRLFKESDKRFYKFAIFDIDLCIHT